jgi:hypothetical protein
MAWVRITDYGIRHINNTQVAAGRWVAANLPTGTMVAAFDIGAIGFYSGAKIVDLGGLVDPTFVHYLYSQQVDRYLRDLDVKWLILPMPQENTYGAAATLEELLGLTDGAGLTKQVIAQFASPEHLWEPGFAATRHAEPRQVVYRLNHLGETRSGQTR